VSYGPNMPPGAPGWRLPSPQHKMVFIDLSAAELCRGLKDRKENGGRDLKALLPASSAEAATLWASYVRSAGGSVRKGILRNR
jgi:hypothetical protein